MGPGFPRNDTEYLVPLVSHTPYRNAASSSSECDLFGLIAVHHQYGHRHPS